MTAETKPPVDPEAEARTCERCRHFLAVDDDVCALHGRPALRSGSCPQFAPFDPEAARTRTIPPMRHAPHADDCPAAGGNGGWKPRPGVCNCGRFYPPRDPSPSQPASGRANATETPADEALAKTEVASSEPLSEPR